MHTEETKSSAGTPEQTGMSPWRVVGWISVTVVVTSVLACVIIAAIRSSGLTQVTVTALNQADEPRDPILPFVKKEEALPDYEVSIQTTYDNTIRLGTKPDTSAVDGLTWHLSEPVSVSDVASISLQEKDKIISDSVAEVQILGDSVTERGYRFDFITQRSIIVGVTSFFGTPIGMAICAGFLIAVVLLFANALPIPA